MSTILEIQVEELQEENNAIKAINQKLQLEKNELKEQLNLHVVSHQRELLIGLLKHEYNEYTPQTNQKSYELVVDDYLANL